MKTATIRIEAELLKAARKHHINVSEAARAGIQEAIRRRQMLENIEKLGKMSVKAKEPTVDTIRRMRDA